MIKIPKEHPWRGRFFVGIAMFILAFIGVALTVIQKERSWDYWRLLAVIFAVMSLGLSLYLKKKQEEPPLVTLWHEVFHWLGLIFSIGLLSNMVHLGILSSFAASLQALALLSLATFLAGVYIEKTFLFIGILMGLFTLLLSYISLYSYILFIPLSIVFLIGFYWFIKTKSHHETKEVEE